MFSLHYFNSLVISLSRFITMKNQFSSSWSHLPPRAYKWLSIGLRIKQSLIKGTHTQLSIN